MTIASSANDKNFAGYSIPPKCAVIEVHVVELKQLFDAIDPSPFRDRDLDPKACKPGKLTLKRVLPSHRLPRRQEIQLGTIRNPFAIHKHPDSK